MLDSLKTVVRRSAVITPAGRGPSIRAFGVESVRMIIPAESVGGAYGVWEMTAQPGFSPPRHLHHREDEVIRVMTGRLQVWCGGATFEVGPGDTAALPLGVVHSFRVISATSARMVMTCVPGGFEGFFAATSGMILPDDMDGILDISHDYGLEYVGPPLTC